MQFHETRFPAAISLGSSGGIERRTEIVSLVNGFEERNSPWAGARRRYDAGIGVRSLDDLDQVVRFFEARHGRLYGFRWKDWLDHKSCRPSDSPDAQDQILGAGDGQGKTFQLVKSYGDVHNGVMRPIIKPVTGTVEIAQDGRILQEGPDYTIDFTTGLVTLSTPPPRNAQISAGFEFDVPVRFDTDIIEINLAAFEAGEIPAIPIIEVRF